MAYAHSANAAGRRHALEDHLYAVAETCARYAAPLDAVAPAYWLGLWHDLGKFSPAWQEYLLAAEEGRRRRGPDHKAAGAALAARYLGPLALAAQGHHGGLGTRSTLLGWLADTGHEDVLAACHDAARAAAIPLAPDGPLAFPPQAMQDPLAFELLLRLLFSALVDADWTDTAAHHACGGLLPGPPDLATLWRRLERDQARLSGRREDAVNVARHEIYQACLEAAEGPVGLYRLTVPTGGGKTRSGLAFGLRHALHHGLERVIVAIPYISITEQTCQAYRAILEEEGDAAPAVLEHHSSAGWRTEEEDEEDGDPRVAWARLAAETWDAPVVVTTTVQLFQSLFSRQTKAMRKIHRLANAVLVLDEAQSLPPHLLTPILDVLARLPAACHTSVVLSTATQPAFGAIPAFQQVPAIEIVPRPERHFERLRRVAYEFRTDPPLGWEEVAALMREGGEQALAVVNTKRDALALLDALADPDALHLSTLLCGAHRQEVLEKVGRLLREGAPCRLVATQVVEAGVDIDFPLVLRALGPLDAIIQAAGRCNREGRLAAGRVIVFAPRDGGLPPGAYRMATGVTQALLAAGDVDLGGAAAAEAYYRELYDTANTDERDIQRLRRAFDFPEVAARFRLIEEDTEGVVVHYGSEEDLRKVKEHLEDLRRARGSPVAALRALQPYIVNLRRAAAERYRREGLLVEVLPGLGEWLGAYDPVRGLAGRDPEAEALII